MDNKGMVDQSAMDIGTKMAPLANPVMGTMDAISPIIEYLLQAIGQGQKPMPTTTSQQTSPYVGPVANPMTGAPMQQDQQPLRQRMMGR